MTGTGINILMYHQVGPFLELTGAMTAHRSTYCRVDRFATQMAWLARMGYTVLSMDQVRACLAGEAPIPPRARSEEQQFSLWSSNDLQLYSFSSPGAGKEKERRS